MMATLASQPLYWTCYFPVYHYISDTLSNKKNIAMKNIREVDIDSELYVKILSVNFIHYLYFN